MHHISISLQIFPHVKYIAIKLYVSEFMLISIYACLYKLYILVSYSFVTAITQVSFWVVLVCRGLQIVQNVT